MRPLNFCRSCGQDFTSLSAGFDAHRVGEYKSGDYKGSLEDWTPNQGRRCLSVGEMRERGWEQTDQGRWFDPTEVARGVSALHRSLQRHQEAA